MADKKLKAKAKKINEILTALYPEIVCALNYENDYQVFVSTLLSAQTTDKKVNEVTPALFAKFPDFESLAKAKPYQLEKLIKRIGLYRAKARNLIASAKKIIADFAGKIPKNAEELMQLPGIGRKSAVVILGNAYGIAAGIAVDTHVFRITKRLGIVSTSANTPVKVERELMQLLPAKNWINFSHRVIRLGREICSARKPLCENCPLNKHCDFYVLAN